MKILTLALLLSLLAQVGCKNNPVEPVKNPREYSWSVQEISDTRFQVIVTDIWGASSKDVYVTCRSGGVRGYKLFHSDGSRWLEVSAVGRFGSSQVGFDLWAVKGFSPTDIWVVGERLYGSSSPPYNYFDSTLVIHFDGAAWSEIFPDIRHNVLLSIQTSSPTDIWFGGIGSHLYHFDGSALKTHNLAGIFPDTNGRGLACAAIAGTPTHGLYAAYNDGSTGYFHFLGYSGNEWRRLDSQFAHQMSIWMSPSGKLYSTFFGYGLYVWDAKTPWSLVYSDGNASVDVYGTSESSIFVTGNGGGLHHYNGLDWYKFKNLESATINLTGIWTDGKEVFVIGNDGFKSYIYHGK